MRQFYTYVIILCVSAIYSATADLFKIGYNPQLGRFCRGYHLYVAIPWDCSGYIQCHGWMSILKKCPPGLYYNEGIRSCDWPYRKSKACPPLEDRVRQYCKKYKEGIFPHPEKCAEYFDCSQPTDVGLGPYRRECPYPMLFDVRVFGCSNKVQDCGDRSKPTTECDYVLNNKPSCKDPCYERPDGMYNEPGKFMSPTFMICDNGKTIGTVQQCPNGQIFDSVHSKCTSHIPEGQGAIFCDNNPNGVLAVTESCAKYIKCNKLGINIIQECPYPRLFSTTTWKCENYTSVSCGDRFEPRSYCEYSQANCSVCPPCDVVKPSCIGLPDGHQLGSAMKNFSNTFFKCQDGRTLEVHCGTDICGDLHHLSLMCGGFFNPVTKQCQDHIPEGQADEFCKSNPNGRIGVTESCAKFVRCNAKNGDGIVQECIYSGLFSTATMSCSPSGNVECGVRPELHDFCHYEAATCDTCEPCHEVKPSCAGKPDGFNAVENKLFSAQFLQCISNRTVRVLYCEDGAVFHPDLKICVRALEPENADAFCTNFPNGVIGDTTTCAGYFNCTASGAERFECSYPALFSVETMKCEDYKNVKCGQRPEPRSLCEYSRYNCSTCEPCDEVKPSCVDLPDGDNAIRGKEFAAQYLFCADGRTLEVKNVPREYFIHGKKFASIQSEKVNDADAYCAANPSGIIAVEESCAQYILCNITDGSSTLKECPYPQLFSTQTLKCGAFETVNCADRPEPHSYCEYMASQCGGCPPCDEVKPSCVGKPDGYYPVPGSLYSKERMLCSSNRTLSLDDCGANHVFHPEKHKCTPYIPEDQAVEYCKANAGGKIGVEESCAKYTECGADGKAEIKECMYAKLFSTVTFTCEDFDDSSVDCSGRHEPHDYCEYEPSSCPACPACDGTQPTCVGKTDGRHPNKLYTRDSYFCSTNRTIAWDQCPEGEVYDPDDNGCVSQLPEDKVLDYCKNNPGKKFPIVNSCARYFDCGVNEEPAVKECPYPQLFDETTLSCADFNLVDCGTRHEPQDYCEYKSSQCNTCPPCNETKPSCVGLPDGPNSIKGQPYTSKYIGCMKNRTLEVSTCEPNFIFSPKTKTCVNSIGEDEATAYCGSNPAGIIAITDSCAKYVNCETGGVQECPYPQLFSTETLKCENFTTVDCGGRDEPQTFCEYSASTCASCPDCNDAKPSCVGLPDGYNTVRNKEFTSSYIYCSKNRTLDVLECENGYFDPAARKCSTVVTPETAESYCAANAGSLIGHSESCAEYYNCSNGVKVLQECPYPELFSTETLKCEDFNWVECGDRNEPLSFCDYKAGQCDPSVDPSCTPCTDKYPSCVGLPDGDNPYPGKHYTPRYIVCDSGRTISEDRCTPGIFLPETRNCTIELDPDTAKKFCDANPGVIATTASCAQYIDCRANNGSALLECKYPELFDAYSQKCVDNFTDVDCGDREKPETYCDYQQSGCDRNNPPTCEACQDELPSCVGLSDGKHPVPGKEHTGEYIVCYGNRTLEKNTCHPSIFDPVIRECIGAIKPEDKDTFCSKNPDGIIGSTENCAQYYNCSVDGGQILMECPYSDLFSTATMTCEAFTDVKCGDRPEPEDFCSYKQSGCNPTNPTTCVDCKDKLPSCVGLPDGLNAVTGLEYTTTYVECSGNRTLSKQDCGAGVFSPVKRECVKAIHPDEVAAYCSSNPQGIIGNTENCAKYFNCSAATGGMVEQECTYPDLFSLELFSCANYTLVTCGSRHEPTDFCEYSASNCTGCPPCDDTKPSCAGKPDGHHAISAKKYSPQYLFCADNRTIDVKTCDKGIFDPDVNECSRALPLGEARDYCTENPSGLIGNSEHCAQYFKCVNGNLELKECIYPALFSLESFTCEYFDNVNCTTRYEPKSLCGYAGEKCPAGDPSCIPCNERMPSCEGKPDGLNAIDGKEFTEQYVECDGGRPLSVDTCTGGVFHPVLKKCVDQLDPDDADDFCKSNSQGIIANADNCAQYINCSAPNNISECPYPQLFNIGLKRCDDFENVDCKTRYEPQAPCEYEANECSPVDESCVPCEKRESDCRGRTDGSHNFHDNPFTSPWVECKGNRTIKQETCDPGVFDFVFKNCTPEIRQESLDEWCDQHPNDLIENHEHCGQFINCTTKKVEECPYPQLYDPDLRKCTDFKDVHCGNRPEPVNPCDYDQFACDPAVDPDCSPCNSIPFCEGLDNGDHQYPKKPFTKYYITCDTGRVFPDRECPPWHIFDPIQKKCTDHMNQTSVVKYCGDNPTDMFTNQLNCAKLIDCSDSPPMQECPYPQLVDEESMKCNDFVSVICGSRFEPQAPCEYDSIKNDCPDCKEPCHIRHPPCLGLVDGKNEVPGREGMHYYMICKINRTMDVVDCPGVKYIPETQECGKVIFPDLLNIYCTDHPTDVFPSPEHCAQYFDCSDTLLRPYFIKYQQECPIYGQLYDVFYENCVPFMYVDCGDRPLMKDRCDHISGLMECEYDPQCQNCTDYYPSCIGQPDGMNVKPGMEKTQYYIVCFQEFLTEHLQTCNMGIFNPTEKICESSGLTVRYRK